MNAIDEHEQAILRARARRLSQVRGRARAQATGATIVVVGVGKERFGIDSRAMRGVVPAPPITALPHLPEWMPGLVLVRGDVLCTISVARWLGIADGEGERYLAILDCERGALGLLVDCVLGFSTVGDDELAASFAARAGEGGARPIRGVTNELVAILDVEAIAAEASLGAASLPPRRVAGS